MDLTRHWYATQDGKKIEVQWTGFRAQGGWMLRLLVDGTLKSESKVRRFAKNFEMHDGPVTVNFWGLPLRHRCKISSGGSVLCDSTQPWNALAFAFIFSLVGLDVLLMLLALFLARR